MSKSYTETVRETFNFKLAEPELLGKGQEASDINDEIARKQYALAVYRKERKAEIDNLSSNLNQVLKSISTKSEDRNVECQKVYDFNARKVLYFYGGEIMLERPMSDYELSLQHAFEQRAVLEA